MMNIETFVFFSLQNISVCEQMELCLPLFVEHIIKRVKVWFQLNVYGMFGTRIVTPHLVLNLILSQCTIYTNLFPLHKQQQFIHMICPSNWGQNIELKLDYHFEELNDVKTSMKPKHVHEYQIHCLVFMFPQRKG